MTNETIGEDAARAWHGGGRGVLAEPADSRYTGSSRSSAAGSRGCRRRRQRRRPSAVIAAQAICGIAGEETK
ncbi:MAG: hypothetical protein U0232_16390 [Thermomicrobiales bacterium]